MAVGKACERCGASFVPNSNRQKFCSDACRFGSATCERCGQAFIVSKKSAGRFCSKMCSYLASDTREARTCTKCGQEKPAESFPKSGGKGALSCWCRNCHHLAYAARRDSDRSPLLKAAFTDFPEQVRAARKAMGLTQKALGSLVGVGNAPVALWERGVRLPHQSTLVKLCEVFGWEMPFEPQPDKQWRIPLRIDDCLSCGEPFPVYKASVRHCSRRCSDRAMGERRHGDGWRAGRVSTGNGYIKIKQPGHPRADNGGYVLEHILVMEQTLGRALELHERVHHKNGTRNDNRPENLELWKVKTKDPPGVRQADYHCVGCRCAELNGGG